MSTPNGAATTSNLRKACDACHASKVKCVLAANLELGASMCQRCIRLGVPCVFSPPEFSTAPRKRRRGSHSQRVSPNRQSSDANVNSGSSVSTSSLTPDTGLDLLSTFQDAGGLANTPIVPMDDLFLSDNSELFDPSFFSLPPADSPMTNTSSVDPLSSPDISPRELKAIAQEQFIKLTNLSCTLQTIQTSDTPPRVTSIEQGIETLSSFWATVNQFSLLPPPSRPANESPNPYFTHKCGASAYVAPNVVMLSFSIAFQLIYCINHLSDDSIISNGDNMARSIPEMNMFSASLSLQDQLKIKAIITNAQLRRLGAIMENVVQVTHHMHADPSVPCLTRTTAQSFKEKCNDLRNHHHLPE
jgi:hypothetical protein